MRTWILIGVVMLCDAINPGQEIDSSFGLIVGGFLLVGMFFDFTEWYRSVIEGY